MVATVQIRRATGSTPDYSTVSGINIRADLVDSQSPNRTTDPVRIPDSGTNQSVWVHTQLFYTSDGTTNTTLSQIKWYMDGTVSFGTDINLYVSMANSGVSGYQQASVETAGESAYALTHHSGLGYPITIGSGFTAANPLSVSGTLTGANHYSDWVVYQFYVGPTASAGASSQETITWQYDEA